MRVAIDAGPLYGHRTGVGEAAGGMIDALRRRGEVALEPYLVSGRAVPLDGHRRLPVPGIVASHLWSRFDHPNADRWFRGVDVVHGTNYVAPPTTVATVVSVYDCWFLRHPELATPVVRRAGHTLRRAVRRGAWVHTTSEASAAEIRIELATDQVVTVALGPPTEPPQVDEPPLDVRFLVGRPFVVAIGTEERRKDLPLLIGAFERLADRHDDLVLVLAGAPGNDTERVAAASAAGAHAGRVHRLGQVGEPTKAWLLRHALALAYPSLDEGFGFPILEAQQSGIPVVASAVGSIPEIAGEAARLVAGRDPDDFADALDEVLVGQARVALVEAGRQNLGRFDWQRTADDLLELYRTVAQR